jgi:hypothetical protein
LQPAANAAGLSLPESSVPPSFSGYGYPSLGRFYSSALLTAVSHSTSALMRSASGPDRVLLSDINVSRCGVAFRESIGYIRS